MDYKLESENEASFPQVALVKVFIRTIETLTKKATKGWLHHTPTQSHIPEIHATTCWFLKSQKCQEQSIILYFNLKKKKTKIQ